MSGLNVTLRQRARFVLSQASADGRLEGALDKLQTLCDPPEVIIKPKAAAAPKKRDHGRGIDAALRLGEKVAHAPEALPADQVGVEVEVVHYTQITVAESSLEESIDSGAVERAPPETAEEAAARLAAKFAEAKRQEAKKEAAKALYKQRVKFIDAKLKPLLDLLVTSISKESERPDNVVPSLIELLAEQVGKPPSAFKNLGPESRLRKEIKQLNVEIAELEEELGIDADDLSEECTDEETDEEVESKRGDSKPPAEAART